jgi:hypothetical protein
VAVTVTFATRLLLSASACWIAALAALATPQPPLAAQAPASHDGPLFQTADNCMACHNGLTTPSGEDVSIGSSWRASMMANSARDPYWQAAVRREAADHPDAVEEIQHECSVCHMPMANTQARARGHKGEIFPHLPIGVAATPDAGLAADGVSCTICHQITPDGLGTPASFTGGYVIDVSASAGPRPLFGQFEVDPGRKAVMRSATGFIPTEGRHLKQSEMCATCHTLYTKALGPNGTVAGELPEQVPYLEWRHSAYRDERSCQSCHMPAVGEPTPIASVLGEPRPGFARHTFRGGNFFMLRMLNRYRTELGVAALPQELESSVQTTVRHLQDETARVEIDRAGFDGARLDIDVAVRNLAGHKLPTGYPSRRAWLHVTVRSGDGRVVFESGAVAPDGSIAGNDNDADPLRYEPHHTEIRNGSDVQIYESIMVDTAGGVTTGLLTGVRYAKDNRLLPRGFDKAAAHRDIAVHGAAAGDADFAAGGDRVRYSVDLSSAGGPFRVEAALRFQPIAFRWARNLAPYDAREAKRFVAYFDSMAAASSETLARAAVTVPHTSSR